VAKSVFLNSKFQIRECVHIEWSVKKFLKGSVGHQRGKQANNKECAWGGGYRDCLLETAQEAVTKANNKRNRCDSKVFRSAFVFGSRITQNCALC